MDGDERGGRNEKLKHPVGALAQEAIPWVGDRDPHGWSERMSRSKLEKSKTQAKAEMSPHTEDINECKKPTRGQETSMDKRQGDEVPCGQALGWPSWSHLVCG